MPSDSQIVEARKPDELRSFRVLLEEYAASLDVDLEFQNFDRELAEFPGDYDPLLLALVHGEPAGCVALRPLEPGICELKRLYVRSAARGLGLGRRLVEAILVEARRRGYERIRLDTIPSMREARSLYSSMGFVPTGPYRFNPVAGAEYLELLL